jgi:hypothetical protein
MEVSESLGETSVGGGSTTRVVPVTTAQLFEETKRRRERGWGSGVVGEEQDEWGKPQSTSRASSAEMTRSFDSADATGMLDTIGIRRRSGSQSSTASK